ncbi:hypothetical protein C5E51_35420 [Nocardia nova]|uniref:AbiJ-related protein n=1 Tax=Nocardia nova TaxID=37330 RepID=UPI000CE9F6B4|nr:hypothetical protein [Nocardia nova]PPJ00188.1 hypothetical protein C5E51_35420 [Nocardia nova]
MKDHEREELRALLQRSLGDTHKQITERCALLGISSDFEGSKRERIAAAVASIPADNLARVAEQMMERSMVPVGYRTRIQDLMWSGVGPEIVERSRRELAATLDIGDAVGSDPDRFMNMLARWWDLDRPYDPNQIFGERLHEKIFRHIFRNPGDWSTVDLFASLGAFEAVDRRFAGFLEDLVSPGVVLDEPKQRRLVSIVNEALRADQLELRENGSDRGYPAFRLLPTGSPAAVPKTLVFAGKYKPELRVSSVIDNDIEVLDNGADVLVFDRPLGADGLSWRDLQRWWRERNPELDDGAAKRQLYARLMKYLPQSSPPQRLLFLLYHEIHGRQVQDLPAMLPEVWLHWDPKTVRERGVGALLGQRMDFLLLLPGPQRVVLEVDGRGHYTDNEGRPSPQVYARHARLDRDLRMRGYEVFRFGAAELDPERPDRAKSMLTEFFTELFHRHGIG